HSQHATLEINDSNFQLLVLDVVAEHQPKVNEYKKAYQEFKKLQKKYVGLLEQTEKAKTDQDYFQFLFDELAAANIEIDEQETLEQELNSLTHAEEIKKNLYAASYLINGFENAVLPKLKEAIAQLQSIEKYETAVSPLAERLQSCNIEIKDIVAEVESLEQHTVFDALRTEEINERLGLLYALQKKHRVNSNAELLEIKHDLAARLNDILFADEDLLQLEKQLEASETALLKQATQISESRKKVIPKIEDHIVKTLAEVGMPTAQIKIEQNAIGKGKFDLNGIDQVRFLFNANKGHQLNELNKVASGGELSRLMLSIKSLIAQKTALPTIIFDEIDTGVSGEVANRVGLIMQELATAMQVIAITHLPQMASKGKAHYFVHKITKDNLTYTQIKRLTQEERVLEIAKMLSGENPKAAALQNARELLQN
ncbi:MAG TPA: DNA repair protein RecN, partial [Pelobium sp.]